MFSFLFPKQSLNAQNKCIYEIQLTSIDGEKIDLKKFKGKKILLVNTASKCGYTPQYKELEELNLKYKDKLVVIGLPANNFLFQEPGNNKDIASFCEKNYGVSFLMTEKISVKGKKIHPLYIWLTQKRYNKFSDNEVKWNFQKYLIDENGNLIAIFPPATKPMSEEITSKL
ncbi:MAG: glutathione peroxidase [Chitinophagaceae bacterium]|nr:glutathione peroxidase [Chitinophagaceae bacterium]